MVLAWIFNREFQLLEIFETIAKVYHVFPDGGRCMKAPWFYNSLYNYLKIATKIMNISSLESPFENFVSFIIIYLSRSVSKILGRDNQFFH